MKLIFFDTGDYLEFELPKNIFVKKWFEYIFEKDINLFNIASSSFQHIENTLNKFNTEIEKSNLLASKINPSISNLFEKNYEFDQQLLNESHKKWAMFTDSHLQELYPQPDYWHNINHCIHDLERGYSALFMNAKTTEPIDEEISKYLEPSHCVYRQHDLVIHYTNLGRHQHNQFLTGSGLDAETNNYDTVSLNFEYQFNLDFGPDYESYGPTPGYEEWCKKNNLEVLPPWIPIGTFMKYDRFEIRKLFHRNLKNNKLAGFSYD